MALYVERVMAPKDVQISIPRTFQYVTLCSKRDFANVIKWRILEMGIYPK